MIEKIICIFAKPRNLDNYLMINKCVRPLTSSIKSLFFSQCSVKNLNFFPSFQKVDNKRKQNACDTKSFHSLRHITSSSFFLVFDLFHSLFPLLSSNESQYFLTFRIFCAKQLLTTLALLTVLQSGDIVCAVFRLRQTVTHRVNAFRPFMYKSLDAS